MAINSVNELRSITVKDVDVDMLKQQTSRLKDVVQSKHVNLAPGERLALRGLLKMVENMTGADKPKSKSKSKPKRLTETDYNRAMDLLEAGKSVVGVCKQLDISDATVYRWKKGPPKGFTRKPSEFTLKRKTNGNGHVVSGGTG
jgi:hypothetical protein